MVRRIAFLAVVALACTYLVASAPAQDGEKMPRRPVTLSERLENFRRDLLGDKNAEKAPESSGGVTRKVTRRPRTVTSPPTGSPNSSPQADGDAAPSANQAVGLDTGSDVTNPEWLTPQAARRAQTGSSPAPVTIQPRASANQNQSAPPRRPVIIRRAPTEAAEVDEKDQANQAPQEDNVPAEPQSAPEPDKDKDEAARPMADEAESADTEPSAVPLEASSEASAEAPAETPVVVPVVPNSEQAATPSAVLFTSESPVLKVEATGPRKVVIGREAQFVVKIHNTGAAANNVVVTVKIPNYVEVLAAQATSGTASSPTPGERREPLEWKINRLDAGGSETLDLKLVPHKSTPLDLAVHCAFTPEAAQTSVEVQEPKLTMAISGPDEVLYGQSKTYKLTVSNPGNGDTENVTVGLLPIGRASGSANHRLGTLRAGESKTIEIELTARQAGAITIKAQAFGEGGLRAEAAEQVLVRRASLRIEVAAPKIKYAGTVGTYRVKVSNSGNATGENVQVSAMLPPDAKYISSTGGGRLEQQVGKVTWTVGTLQPGGERMFEMQCALSAPGENRTQFVAAAEGDLSAAATSTTRVEALADLKLEVRDPQGPVPVGEDTVYEIHVRNRGTKPAENIDLTVFFSEGLEATTVEGGPHDIATGQVSFKPLVSLGAGDSAVFKVHARADKVGNHVFRAEVVCQSPQMKLAAEEATHFYGEDAADRDDISREDDSQTSSRGEISRSR